MKERPILFSGAMVRALLSGQKTQTRRIVKPQPPAMTYKVMQYHHPDHLPNFYAWVDTDPTGPACDVSDWIQACPYGQPGEQLVVASEIPEIGRMYCAGSNGVIYSRARGNWRPLKPHLNANGYPSVTVMIDGRKTTRCVHTLVCSAFYGPAPFKGAQVRHLDGNPERNTPFNLAWGTQADNWQDRKAHGNGCEGEKHHAAKLNDEERAHVRFAIERGLCSQRHAARALGMAQGSICRIMNAVELQPADVPAPENLVPTINLDVAEVRVERLQDITPEDALAEGALSWAQEQETQIKNVDGSNVRWAFIALWEAINGPGSWEANPWLWVVEFKRITP